jgi:hypothetical protein
MEGCVGENMVSPAVWASAGVAFLNIALSLVLIVVYVRNHKSFRSYFTLGLIVFSVLFLFLNFAIVGLWFFLFTNLAIAESIVGQAMGFMFVINLAEFIGLTALVRITLR